MRSGRAEGETAAFVVRYRWRGRVWATVLLSACAVGAGVSLVVDRSYSGWSDAGTAALGVVFALGAVSWGMPAARRRIAVRLDTDGITLGGSPEPKGTSGRYGWDRIAGIRLYTVGWIDSMSETTSTGEYRYLQLDLVGGEAARTEITSACIDAAELASALESFAAHPPPLDAGAYFNEWDAPMAAQRKTSAAAVLGGLTYLGERLRARRERRRS